LTWFLTGAHYAFGEFAIPLIFTYLQNSLQVVQGAVVQQRQTSKPMLGSNTKKKANKQTAKKIILRKPVYSIIIQLSKTLPRQFSFNFGPLGK
jgi:hypothetical protein